MMMRRSPHCDDAGRLASASTRGFCLDNPSFTQTVRTVAPRSHAHRHAEYNQPAPLCQAPGALGIHTQTNTAHHSWLGFVAFVWEDEALVRNRGFSGFASKNA